ncbi:Non-specific serine/threonine protein kinase [Bertholletia excelsa]
MIPATCTHVGRYEIGKTLGEGSFTKVKYAKNIETGESFAIKMIDRGRVLRHKMVERIKREITTMKLIKHPNVLKLIEVMANKSKIYLVLEYVDGGELFDNIARKGKLKEDEARKYFQQPINAVDYCHSRGPENLLLDSYGIIKVSDFGLHAFSQQEDGLLHTACGTPNYVAPEVLKDKGYDGAIADIWSCGVIFLELTNFHINTATLSYPSWFSSGAKRLIKRIVDPNPLTRITIPEILQNEWFRKGYKPPEFEQERGLNLDDLDAVFSALDEGLVTEKKEKHESVNAFEFISRSQGLNLENLFEKQMGLLKREMSFASKCSANDIISKIEQTAKPMGFNVHKQNYKVLEVAPSLHMVELRKTGGDTGVSQGPVNFYKKFSSSLKDGMWNPEPIAEETR